MYYFYVSLDLICIRLVGMFASLITRAGRLGVVRRARYLVWGVGVMLAL